MKIKRYVAADMRQALKMVREEQGPDAVILSTRPLDDGLELIAAIDYDESLMELASDQFPGVSSSRPSSTTAATPAKPSAQRSRAATLDRDDSVSPELPETAGTGRNDRRRTDPAPSAVVASRRPLNRSSSAGEGTAGWRGDAFNRVEPELGNMKSEIAALRQMLECQLSTLTWNDMARRNPVRAAALRDLVRVGLSPDLASDMVNGCSDNETDLGRILRLSLARLAQRLEIIKDDPLEEGGVIALVGPTGVGKTTTIAKLAARYAQRHGPESIALISADDYRIGAQEQLFTYGRLLNIPVYVATTAEQLKEKIARLEHADLVLVDTAGTGQRDQRFDRVVESLDQTERQIRPYLVMAANVQMQAMEQSLKAFGRLPLAGGIVTKLDEAGSLGGLLSVLDRHRLPLAYTTDGQQVPENLRRASSRNLVRRAIELMKESEPGPMNDEYLAQQFGAVRYAHA